MKDSLVGQGVMGVRHSMSIDILDWDRRSLGSRVCMLE